MSELPCKLVRISPYAVELGEGPHYDEVTGRLYHVDLVKGGCYSLDVTQKIPTFESHYFEPGLGLIVPIHGTNGKQFVIAQNRSLYSLNWSTRELKLITTVDEGKDTRVNDGKCDSYGRLWFGTMNWEREPGVFIEGLGSLYSINSKREVSLKQDKITISNGLAWSNDNAKFYFIDSHERQVWVYDYDNESANISNRKTVFDYKRHEGTVFNKREVPDGMTADLEGKLWFTSFNGKKILRIDPETGKILGVITTPATKTTSVTWGGPDFRTLYVTSATYGADKDEIAAEPNAGAVFKVTFDTENIRGSINHSMKLQ